MTPDERVLLTNFLGDLNQSRTGQKDTEAQAMIDQAFAANPDAGYLMVQHAILSDQALHAAQERIAQLEAQAASVSAPRNSFLGGGPAWSPGQTSVPQTPPASPFSAGGGLGSFLRNAGTTAAGVAGGELLFEGLSGLFGGHRGFGMGGFGGGFGGGYGAPVENVTINNYDDAGGDDSGGGWDDNSGSSDI